MLRGKGSGEKVSFKTRMEDTVRRDNGVSLVPFLSYLPDALGPVPSVSRLSLSAQLHVFRHSLAELVVLLNDCVNEPLKTTHQALVGRLTGRGHRHTPDLHSHGRTMA